MKKILVVFFVLFNVYAPAFAEDAVFLKQDEIARLKVPKANPELSRIEYEDETLYVLHKKGSNYYDDKDECVFESKAGKVFSKIVDDWAVNNKLNNYASEIVE